MAYALNLIAAIAILFLPLSAMAQVAPDQLDIIGLKLGMTVAQAKAVLEKYDPKMKVKTLYTTDSEGDSHRGFYDETDTHVTTAKIKTPNGLVGSLVTHAFSEDRGSGSKEITDPKGVVRWVSGEWFWLEFTPTDDGGKLYAISRQVVYPAPGETADDLSKKFADKYGKPDLHEHASDFWVYDVRGRLLANESREFQRCQARAQGSEAMYNTFNTNFSSLDKTLEMTKHDIYDFAPHFGLDYPHDYRQCGTQLALSIYANNDRPATGFTIRLSDQNATHFDNGVESYWKKKLPPAPKVAAPKL